MLHVAVSRNPKCNLDTKKCAGGYYLQDLEITRHPWGHTVRLQVEKEHAGLGFCFYWG